MVFWDFVPWTASFFKVIHLVWLDSEVMQNNNVCRLYRKICCKVKYTLVHTLRLCTGRTAHRGSRGIALLFLDHGTRRVWGVSVTPRALFIAEKDPVPIVQEAVWAPGPVWTGAENLTPTGIRSPDRPARSQWLYRLLYPALRKICCSLANQKGYNCPDSLWVKISRANLVRNS